MKYPLKKAFVAALLVGAAPAAADIIRTDASAIQGLNVHNDGSATSGTTVTGQLGQNSGLDVLFTGTTTDSNTLLLSSGQGQATVTGDLDTGTSNPNDTFDITSFSIALANNASFDAIELALMGAGTVSFSLLDANGTAFTSDANGAFTFDLANGENKFAFQAINGQSITGLSFDVTGGGVANVKQVRISPAAAAVPEPATWGMMLLGFGALGFAMRRGRRRTPALRQIA